MTNRTSFWASLGRNWLLTGLIASCALIELVLFAADMGWIDHPRFRAVAYEFGAFWPGLMRDWRANFPAQPWTMFVTYGFLHGSLLHMTLNMFTLASLGEAVTERIGAARMLLLYMVSMVGGAAVYGALSDGRIPMVGASGALFGLAGAIVAWIWAGRSTIMGSLRATWRILLFLLAINVVLYVAFGGKLAWQTHLGGFITGWIAGLLLDRRRTR